LDISVVDVLLLLIVFRLVDVLVEDTIMVGWLCENDKEREILL